MTPLDAVLGVVALVVTGAFALSTLSRGRWRARSRVAMAGTCADAVIVLLLCQLLLSWSVVPAFVWLVPIGLVAAGVAGAVLRWNALPPRRPDRPRWRAVTMVALRTVGTVLVLGLVFWP